MSIRQKVIGEIKELALATLYFTLWIGFLLFLKSLILAEYHIVYRGLSMALVGALVLSKVALVLEHVSMGGWVKRQAAVIDVILRTVLYSAGVFVVILLEKSFEGRHEYGGFGSSIVALFKETDVDHVLFNTIGLSAALLGYNALCVVRRRLGEGGLLKMFLEPFPDDLKGHIS